MMESLLEQINNNLRNKAIIKPISSLPNTNSMKQKSIKEQANIGSNDYPLDEVQSSPKITVTRYMTEITHYPDGREFIRCWIVNKDKKDFTKKKQKKVLKEVNMSKCEEEVY